MKNILILAVLFLSTTICTAQTNGDQLRQEGNLEGAIEAYMAEFSKAPGNVENTYKIASTYALIYQKDSAFRYLDIALKDDYSLWPLADTDFFSLIDDPRWEAIENAQIRKYQTKNDDLKQPEYAKRLLRLIMKDQSLDYYIDQAKDYYMKNGRAPHWYYPLGAAKQKIGENNFSDMKALLEKCGWPTYSTVGDLAADAPLLMINHHENDSVRIAYLPKIKEACLNGEGSCMEYAKIQDRILVNADKPQIYGMQFRYNEDRALEPFPIKNPEYVDQRRKEIGLEPLKDYLRRKINYEWTVVQKNK